MNTEVRVSTPEIMDDPVEPEVDHAPDPLDSSESPDGPEQQGRQKYTAAVRSFYPSAFLAKMMYMRDSLHQIDYGVIIAPNWLWRYQSLSFTRSLVRVIISLVHY